jgi:ABC-type uncharacterized transport system ATPase subunit
VRASTVRSGEVVGIAGVEGNGQTALIEALTGLRPVAGQMLRGPGHHPRQPARAPPLGIAHIPEDRNRMGLISNFTIAENMVLDTYYDDRFSKGPQVDWPTVQPGRRRCGRFRRAHALGLPAGRATCRAATSRR